MKNRAKEKTRIFAAISSLAILVLIGLIFSNCASSSGNLVIKPGVTAIKDDAYRERYYRSVEIPEGVTTIGKGAFAFNFFTSVVIPYGVTAINDNAFYYNPHLRSVIIPETVTRIGEEAFGRCPDLKMVYIPESVTDLDSSAFNTHKTGKQVTLIMEKDLPGEYIGDYKTLIENNRAKIIRYRGREKDIVIPAEINGVPVTGIGDYAFMQKQVASVVIPDTVTSIGNSAFFWNEVSSITIPGGVGSIGNSAFEGNQITALALPGGVKTIGEHAFSSNKISSLVIPGTVSAIGNSAFEGNEITALVLPGGVKTIGEHAFSSNKISSLVIPDTVTSIGKYAFADNQLTNVVLPGSIAKFDDPFDDKVTVTGEGITTLTVVSKNLTLSDGTNKTTFIPSSGKTNVPVRMTVEALNRGEMSLSVNLSYAFKPGHTYTLSKRDRAYAFPSFKILLQLDDKTTGYPAYHWNYETSVPDIDYYSGRAGRDAGRVSIQLKEEGVGQGSIGWF
jgi:hypothetical protein